MNASQGRVRPAHALSELWLSFFTITVDKTEVALDMIMCGDNVTDRTPKVHVHPALDQSK